jgi:hypothetical protein
VLDARCAEFLTGHHLVNSYRRMRLSQNKSRENDHETEPEPKPDTPAFVRSRNTSSLPMLAWHPNCARRE